MAVQTLNAVNLGTSPPPPLRAGPRVPVPSGLSRRHRGPDHDRGNSAAYLPLYFHENRNPVRLRHARERGRRGEPAHGPHGHHRPLAQRHFTPVLVTIRYLKEGCWCQPLHGAADVRQERWLGEGPRCMTERGSPPGPFASDHPADDGLTVTS